MFCLPHLACLSLLTLALPAFSAAPPTPAAKAGSGQKASMWEGYQRLDFEVNGKKSWLVLPKQPAPGNPWAWRTEFFGHEPQGDIALLGKGFHIAYTDVTNHYGAPAAMGQMDAFYNLVRTKHKLALKVTLEGFSRGGLFALNWAIRRPGQVACLYLDAPVCDVLSWPAGFGRGKRSTADWERCSALYGFADDAAALRSLVSPIHNLKRLALAQVPILSVVGDADKVVPLAENTALLKARYQALGGPIEVIIKPGVDHHPHSLVDPTPIVEFIVKHSQP